MNRFTKHAALLLAATSLLGAAPSFAQTAAPAASAPAGSLRIGVVNAQTILRDASVAKSINEQLQAKQNSLKAEVSKREQALHQEEDALGQQRSALAKDAFDAKVKAFQQKVTDYQKDVQAKKISFDHGLEEAYGQAQKVMSDIVSELAKEKGYQLVITSAQTPYYDPSLDITAEVLSRLNQRLPRVDVKFGSGAAPAPAAKPDKK